MNWSFPRWRAERSSPAQDPEPRVTINSFKAWFHVIYFKPYTFEVAPPILPADYDSMVTLPPGICVQEWIATHALGIVQ